MLTIPYPRSYVAAQDHLLRELESECRVLEGGAALRFGRLRAAVQRFAREVKEQRGTVERALALLRACLKASGLDATYSVAQQELNDRTFAWTMEVYYGPS